MLCSLALLVLLLVLLRLLGLLESSWRRGWRVLGLDLLRWRWRHGRPRCGWRHGRSRWGAKGSRFWLGSPSPIVLYLLLRALLALRCSLLCRLYGKYWFW
jgi:hypothetical protein